MENIAELAKSRYHGSRDRRQTGAAGLRERKRRETRLALSHAAIRLSMQRGWENVTVDDIAAAANVSPRTFRNYFSTKAEAVAAGHLERMLRIADELRTPPADEKLWTAITNFFFKPSYPSPRPKANHFCERNPSFLI